ncbi:MAG: family transcriptional regulator, regulator of embCAB operon [Solirubrobacteraceae bacterium]|nr:family transcriptional regulator, regulator of embCAB operon [Solirubrobacteraceae bacterium]
MPGPAPGSPWRTDPNTSPRASDSAGACTSRSRLEAGIRGRQARLLFAYLVLHRARAVRRDELVDVLWPDEAPASPDGALNTLLSRLRKALGDGAIAGRSDLRLVLPAGASVDVESAFAAIERTERALERADWAEASAAADVALEVAERGFLPEVGAGWAEDERRRLEEVRLRALECVASCGLALGGARLSATERAARRLIEAAPYRETGHRYLMQALAERGRVAEALRVFDDVRRLLQAELGAPPSAGLRALHERLLSEQAIAPQPGRDDPLAVGSATVTALFSDLVCTDDVAPELADDLRRTHARLLRQAAAGHGGQVQAADGGALALFHRPPGGLACAVALQQAVARHNRRHPARALAVRAALHCGGPSRAGEEHASVAPALARQLCEHAAAGQILATAPLRALAAPGQRLRDDATAPAGAGGPIAALEVVWEPAEQPPFALPGALRSRERTTFVGREPELERLARLYAQAAAGACRVAFVRGEPGIGKTRLARELGLRAHADGAVVLYGRCDEEPLLPHQPGWRSPWRATRRASATGCSRPSPRCCARSPRRARSCSS